jgi:hypothetical protein
MMGGPGPWGAPMWGGWWIFPLLGLLCIVLMMVFCARMMRGMIERSGRASPRSAWAPRGGPEASSRQSRSDVADDPDRSSGVVGLRARSLCSGTNLCPLEGVVATANDGGASMPTR